jgi:hypothetical protein
MQGTPHEADLLVSDKTGKPVVMIELKNRQDMTRNVAVHLRRNLAAHDALGSVPYFLLLSQDAGYLWKNSPASDLLALPSAEFPMRAVVERYSPHTDGSRRLGGSEFSALVFRWLQSLTQPSNGIQDAAETTLKEAGVLEAMRGGSVADQPRV